MKMLASNLTTEQKQICRQIRIDALREFISARTPSEDYVRSRYAAHPESFRIRKLKEVRERIALAEILVQIEFDTAY